MDEFLAYKKEVRSATSGDTYTSVSEQTTKQEAELKAEQDKLTAYMRDNNVAVLEEQAKAASAYLTQLLAEFSQLKLQHQLLEATSAERRLALRRRHQRSGRRSRPSATRQFRPPLRQPAPGVPRRPAGTREGQHHARPAQQIPPAGTPEDRQAR